MDNIGSTNMVYKRIHQISVAVFLALIQIYLGILSSGVDILNFTMIEGRAVRLFAELLAQFFIFSLLYWLVYQITFLFFKLFWILSHKEIYVRGLWLQIHEKDNLRIGTVEIKQNFYTISAKGHNISPQMDGNQNYTTDWKYYLGKVSEDSTVRDFIGCYTTTKLNSDIPNDGIHMLKISKIGKNGYPTVLEGQFSDTFKVTGNSVDNVNIEQHKGRLIFLRMTKECKDYLMAYDGFHYEALASPHFLERFPAEPFVMELKKCIANKTKVPER